LQFNIFATLLLTTSTLILSGCGSHKTLFPIEQRTVDNAQYHYEHLQKPIVYENPPTETQLFKFKNDLKKIFHEINSFKKNIKGKSVIKRRYGKNRIVDKPKQDAIIHKSQSNKEEKLLYQLLDE